MDRVVGCDNGVKEVVAAAVQYAHTSNCRGDHTECDRRVVGSEKWNSGRPVAVAEAAGSEPGESFQEEMVGQLG